MPYVWSARKVDAAASWCSTVKGAACNAVPLLLMSCIRCTALHAGLSHVLEQSTARQTFVALQIAAVAELYCMQHSLMCLSKIVL